jgi:hypothetical protein
MTIRIILYSRMHIAVTIKFRILHISIHKITSQRALETAAAAANRAAPEGNNKANKACNSTVLTKGNNSTAAALAAAHKPAKADVNGKIAPALDP